LGNGALTFYIVHANHEMVRLCFPRPVVVPIDPTLFGKNPVAVEEKTPFWHTSEKNFASPGMIRQDVVVGSEAAHEMNQK
jgi:hypothetical protein